MGNCAGSCCAAFPFPATPEELRARWEDRPADTPALQGFKRDDLYIADMLIKLEPSEVEQRGEEFDLWQLIEPRPKPEDHVMYTCKHWDAETKLCTAYDERPVMCAEYPYGGKCEHGCGFTAPHEVRWAAWARSVKMAAGR